jgi:hypothetical protein
VLYELVVVTKANKQKVSVNREHIRGKKKMSGFRATTAELEEISA